MVWQPATIARVVVPLLWLGCGGGAKPPQEPKPEPTAMVKPPPPPPETEEDRERKRHAEALAIVPDKSSCLPTQLKSPTAPRLELAVIAWNLDSTKVAVLAGDDLHIFNAQTKAHETSFSIRSYKCVNGDPTEI